LSVKISFHKSQGASTWQGLDAQQIVLSLDLGLFCSKVAERNPLEFSVGVVAHAVLKVVLDVLKHEHQLAARVAEVGLGLHAQFLNDVAVVNAGSQRFALEGGRKELLVVPHDHGLRQVLVGGCLPAILFRSLILL